MNLVPAPTPHDPVNTSNLTPRQEKAIAALLTEPTVVKAAESVKVGERTIRRWLANPEFERAYKAARRSAFDVAIGLTQRYAGLAVHTLAKVLADTSAPHAAKVSAATAMLKFAREALELDDLARRLDELERRGSAAKHLERAS
jgi:pantoate kinase